jgi:hypothetical protein
MAKKGARGPGESSSLGASPCGYAEAPRTGLSIHDADFRRL